MSIILYILILWLPALLIFPLTRLIQAYISSNHSQPYSDHLLIFRNIYHSNKIAISELNNYKKKYPVIQHMKQHIGIPFTSS
jgi:hypothetical protein